MRKIVLDTETTGLDPAQGNRIIEIGCVEIVGRKLTGRHYHQYINPERDSEEGALAVHGITTEFLADKPVFAQIAESFLAFIDGAELIIHNAPFDIGFLDHELSRVYGAGFSTAAKCAITDTLVMAKERHPGQRNNLDALCKRYDVDNSQRELHGALLDAEILADLYLVMTGGQVSLLAGSQSEGSGRAAGSIRDASIRRVDPVLAARLQVLSATPAELAAHEEQLALLRKKAGSCAWDDAS
ncbi:MAG TPA: DNA polymerase III subunit epsilon [Pseudomonadales bacterium]|nr:DNA polymerase III subunit epsilon [Pseudomonadales bacterium]